MSMTLSPDAARRHAESRRAVPVPKLAWLSVAALLLVEYLLTSYSVDVAHLVERSDWLGMFGNAGSAGPIVLSIVTATVLTGGSRLLAELRAALDRAAEGVALRSPLGRLTSLAIHLVGFSAFLSLTSFFARAGDELPAGAGLLAVAWIGSVVVAILALAGAVVPIGSLFPVVRRAGPALGLGAVLGVAAWAGGSATFRLWDPLSEPTLHGVALLLGTVSSDVAFDSTTFTLAFEGFRVVIAPTCSGYEGIGLLAVLMSAYVWAFRARLRFPHVLALLPIGIALSWLANVLRISGLMIVGARWSPEVALGSFHSKAGWVLFCALALALVALTRRAVMFSQDAKSGDLGATWNPTAAYVVPLLALVAVHMVTGLFAEGLPLLYPLGIVAAASALWWYRGTYRWLLRPAWSWEATAIGVVAFGLWIMLEPAPDVAELDDWRRTLDALPLPVAAAWLALRAFGSVLVVPLVEELAFRGYLLRRLFSADFTSVAFSKFGWLSLLVSSVAYGLLHERWLAGILAGVLFAIAQYRRGRLVDAVLAHATTNLLLALHAIGWQRWSLWM